MERLKVLHAYLNPRTERKINRRTGEVTEERVGGRDFDVALADPFLSVVLWDEIEKAHSDVWRAILDISGDGTAQLRNGERTCFYHSFLIMTSNVAAKKIAEILNKKGRLGFKSDSPEVEIDWDRIRKVAMEEVESTFDPEFIGRIRENIIVFNPLSPAELRLIRDKQILDWELILERRFPVHVIISDDVKEYILSESGDHRADGARLLESKIAAFLIRPLGRIIATGQVKREDMIRVDLEIVGEKPKVVFSKEAPQLVEPSQETSKET